MNADTLPSHPKRGVALLTVMLVFAVAAIIAVSMLSRQQLDIVRTSNMLEQTQATQYALGAEELARQTLLEDAVLTPGIDYPGQRWASLREGIPIEHGQVSLQIEDLQGRFNINALVNGSAARVGEFQKLLKALGILANAQAIADQVTAMATSGGIRTQLGYPILASTTALRKIESLSADDYNRLLPYVAAPPERSSLLNINTASDTLIRATAVDDDVYQSLRKLRTTQGYVTGDQLLTIGNAMGMTVRSNYFGLTARVRFNNRTVTLNSVIYRISVPSGQTAVSVIHRDMSNF